MAEKLFCSQVWTNLRVFSSFARSIFVISSFVLNLVCRIFSLYLNSRFAFNEFCCDDFSTRFFFHQSNVAFTNKCSHFSSFIHFLCIKNGNLLTVFSFWNSSTELIFASANQLWLYLVSVKQLRENMYEQNKYSLNVSTVYSIQYGIVAYVNRRIALIFMRRWCDMLCVTCLIMLSSCLPRALLHRSCALS